MQKQKFKILIFVMRNLKNTNRFHFHRFNIGEWNLRFYSTPSPKKEKWQSFWNDQTTFSFFLQKSFLFLFNFYSFIAIQLYPLNKNKPRETSRFFYFSFQEKRIIIGFSFSNFGLVDSDNKILFRFLKW